jgi:hypothetical protein
MASLGLGSEDKPGARLGAGGTVGGYRTVRDGPIGPARAAPALSRRRLLAASTLAAPLAALSSCAVPDPLAGPPGPSQDVRTLRAAISAEQALVTEYQKVLAAQPGLAASLRTFLTQHQDHLGQLKSRLIVPPHVTPSPAASPTAAASPPPASAAAARASLAEAERKAAAAQLQRLASATPALAQLLASIAASETTHAVALGGAA